MIPKVVLSVNAHQPTVLRPSLRRDQRAVSEVLGVVMMLAMVVTIMGGVWIFLNPYISDFEDKTFFNFIAFGRHAGLVILHETNTQGVPCIYIPELYTVIR